MFIVFLKFKLYESLFSVIMGLLDLINRFHLGSFYIYKKLFKLLRLIIEKENKLIDQL